MLLFNDFFYSIMYIDTGLLWLFSETMTKQIVPVAIISTACIREFQHGWVAGCPLNGIGLIRHSTGGHGNDVSITFYSKGQIIRVLLASHRISRISNSKEE